MDDTKHQLTPHGSPAVQEDLGGRYVETELGPVWKPHSGKRKGPTPHSLLKHRCRNALTAFRQAHGLSIVLLPSFVGTVTAANGKQYPVGRKGQADDTIIVGKDGVLWGVVFAEYKAGADRQSEAQGRFEGKALAVGAVYLLCRKPQDLTDCLTQILATHGGLF